MIFLSHNSKDKRIVEPFANKLAEVFGRDNVFYDSWSIQPGDGIIDKMESGLKNAKYFFFFVSANSLQSNMVRLEWQNAIVKASNGNVKFIPVRLDKSEMPMLLAQTLYLDVYQNGFDLVLSQMIDVSNGENTYRGTATSYENVKARVKCGEKELNILIYAETYTEPLSKYAIILSNEEDDISWNCGKDNVVMYGFNKDVVIPGVNALAFNFVRATSPEFPIRINITSKTKVKFITVCRQVNEEKYKAIPIEYVSEL